MHCPRNKEAISKPRFRPSTTTDNLLIRFEEPRRPCRRSNSSLGEMESNFRDGSGDLHLKIRGTEVKGAAKRASNIVEVC